MPVIIHYGHAEYFTSLYIHSIALVLYANKAEIHGECAHTKMKSIGEIFAFQEVEIAV